MSLNTRCIHCKTVFRITLEQLQAHGGQVRCGRCMQVFNGLQALTPDVAAAGEPAAATAPASEHTPPVPETDAATPPASASMPAAAGDAGPEPDTPTATTAVPAAAATETAPAAEAPTIADAVTTTEAGAVAETLQEILPEPAAAEPLPGAQASTAAAARSAPVAADNPFVSDTPAELPAGRRSPLLKAAMALLALMLAAQAVYFYRGEIAARAPWARQLLTQACDRAGCTVSLPQNAKAVLIEASDLQVIDPAQPSRIQLTATLRNHAGYDVAYPALDLVLTNVNDHTLVRRIFLPAEYLAAGRDPAAGIAANAELTVRLAMETGNLGAAGFRLAVLPAPSR